MSSTPDIKAGPGSPIDHSTITVIVILIVVLTTTVGYSATLNPALSSGGSVSVSTVSTSASTSGQALLAWNPSTGYPVPDWTQSCVESGGYVYCVGGLTGPDTVTNSTSSVYFAPLTPTGIGAWKNTTAYWAAIRSESCVAESGTIYCVGGYAGSALTSVVSYAPLSATGVGPWANTTSYPISVWLTSCSASTSGIYCVGGETESSGLVTTSAVYFAPFTSTGVGQWVSTANYPVVVKQESCVASASDLYCVGGYLSTSVYYAPLLASGVGQWSNTTAYPFTVGANLASCVTVSSDVYCVGGHTGANVSSAVYRAPISASGVGQWVGSTSYPIGVWGESCVSSESHVYCIGGETASGSIIASSWSSS
jgi:hypothetical protein